DGQEAARKNLNPLCTNVLPARTPTSDCPFRESGRLAFRRLKLLFIRQGFPSRFTRLGVELNRRGDFECSALVSSQCMTEAAQRIGLPHFSFEPDSRLQRDKESQPRLNIGQIQRLPTTVNL